MTEPHSYQLRIQDVSGGERVVPLPFGDITLGRAETSNIQLDGPGIQPQQALLSVTAEQVTLTDVTTRQQLTVNGRTLAPNTAVDLQAGDTIVIGGFSLVLEPTTTPDTVRELDQPAEEEASAAEERTPNWQITIAPQNDIEKIVPFTFVLPARLPEDGLLIGRDEICDILLDHPRVQRQHARLTWSPDAGLQFTDLSFRSRTRHNDNPLNVSEPVTLALDDVLDIGPYRLTVEEAPLPEAEDEERSGDPALSEIPGTEISRHGNQPPNDGMPDFLRTAPPPPPDYTQQFPPGLGRHSVRLIEYLPQIYQTDFTSRFLAMFEAILLPISWNIDNFDLFMGPDTAPLEFVDWLANWFGISFDATWSEKKRRTLLLEANELFARRGTRYALSRLLEIYTGRVPEIIEEGQEPYTFVVRLPLRERDVNRTLVEQLIDLSKPAHTSYTLEFDERLDVDVMWEKLDF